MTLLTLLLPSAIAYTQTPVDLTEPVDLSVIDRGTVTTDLTGTIDSFILDHVVPVTSTDITGPTDLFSISRGTVVTDLTGTTDSSVVDGPLVVTFDAVGSATAAGSANASSLTYSHACTGTNRLLVVGVAVGNNPDTGKTISSVTYAGTGMSLKGTKQSGNATDGYVSMYYLVAPSTGANNVVVTMSSSCTDLESGSISFVNVNQTSPMGSAFTAAGNSTALSVGVTGTVASSLVVDAACCGSDISSSGKTMRTSRNLDTNTAAGNYATSTSAASGTVTMSYTATATDFWAQVAAEILAAGAAQSWTQSPVDSAGVTDSFIFSIAPITALDPINIQDTFAISQAKVLSDTSTVTDPFTIDRSLVALDLAVPTDSSVLARSLVSVDDSGETDSSVVQPSGGPGNFTVTQTDPAGLTDSTVFDLAFVYPDLAGVTDVWGLAASAVASDLTGTTDSAVLDVQHLQAPVDASVPTDSFLFGWGSVPVDSCGPTDSFVLSVDHGISSVDSAGSLDFCVYLRPVSSVDSAGATDSAAFFLSSVIVDSSGETDFATGFGAIQYDRTFSDSAGAVDASSLAPALFPAPDPAGLTDSSVVTPGRQVAGQDIAWPTDIGSLGIQPAVTDLAGLTDSSRFALGAGPVDPVTETDLQVWDQAHAYQDTAGVTDLFVLSQGFGLLPVDVAFTGGCDPAIISHGFELSSVDPAGVGEYFPFIDHLPSVTDLAGVTDSVLLAPGREEPAGVTDLVTMALGEVDQDSAGLGDVVSVAMGGVLFTQDVSATSDSIGLGLGLVKSDLAGVTDSAVVLRFNDQQQVDPAGLVDLPVFSRSSVIEDFPIETDVVAVSRGLVLQETITIADVLTFDAAKVNTDPAGPTDLASLGRGPGVIDLAGLQDQAVIVLSVSYADTNRVSVTDSAVVSLAIKISVIDSAGVTDVPGVVNGVLRLVTVSAVLAPQERILASLASPERIAAILGLPVPVVASLAAQGRISVVLATPPRIVAHLEVQP